MNVKEATFSALENVLNDTLEKAADFFQSKRSEFENIVLPKMVEMKVIEKDTRTVKTASLYRDIMVQDEYNIDKVKIVREVGVVLTSKMELARLEILHVFYGNKENEKAYLSEVGLGDIPMLALFIGSLEIDIKDAGSAGNTHHSGTQGK